MRTFNAACLAGALMALPTMHTSALAEADCPTKLLDVIVQIDSAFAKDPRGPITELRSYLKTAVPIAGCSREQFSMTVAFSKFFDQLDIQTNIDLAIFTRDGLQAGIAYTRKTGEISYAYAYRKKWGGGVP